VQHLGYAAERLTELAENKTTVVIGYDLHVHKADNTPAAINHNKST